MSCSSCQNQVEKALSEVTGVKKVSVDLRKAEATIEMNAHLPLEKLQDALNGTPYRITLPGMSTTSDNLSEAEQCCHEETGQSRTFYCPMHCESNKTYNKPGSCPICGMDLIPSPVAEPVYRSSNAGRRSYTCPMHPEIVRDEPGSCPICGMDLVPADTEADTTEENRTYQTLLTKFKTAVFFTLPIFIIAMSEMIPGNPLFRILDLKYWNWVELVLSLPVVFYATWMFFERAWRSVITWHLNMFTLIGMGAGTAWLFSVVAVFFPGIFPDAFKTHHGTVYVYFEAATVILTLVLLGQLMEARAHGKTNAAIKALLKLAPATATKITGDKEQVVSVHDIHKGDMLRVKPGEKIPVDGTISEGETHVDESMITGEPIPADKKAGDTVKAGTINGNKTFIMTAEKVGAETLLAQIIDMVNKASRSKAPVQKLADKISRYFVLIVVLIAILTFILWAISGPDPALAYALVNAIAVLIIACPCALGLATPMSVMVGIGKGAQSGILIKNAEALERMNETDIVVIDKTGTITEGKPSVEKVIPVDNHFSEKDILQKIISLNSNSEHPLAQATLRYGKEQNIEAESIVNFETVAGKGVTGVLENKKLALGNVRLMEQEQTDIPEETMKQVAKEQQHGKTVSYLSEENKVIGYVVISDKIKATAEEAVRRLQDEGLKVWLFTGDNENTAKAVSDTLGLNGYKAGMLPEDKLMEIKKLQAAGNKVAMAGDGINDAPALSQADIGIAMGTGTDVAIESAAITLVKGDLNGIAKARLLSEKVMKNIRQNLWFALGYNVLGIPVAAGILYPVLGLLLSPMIAALAMSFSSVSVITNSLRLRKIKL
jgi:Cu2+-exporting ATPase